MERTIQFPAKVLSRDAPPEHESGLFSTESVLNLQKLIFAGSPLSEVLANIAQLVESQAEGMSCTIWLPDEDGKELHCAAAPSLPGFMLMQEPRLLVRKADLAAQPFIGRNRCM